MNTENMGYTANAIRSYLEEQDKNYTYDEDKKVFVVPISLSCRLKFTTMLIQVADDSTFGVSVPCPLSPNVNDEATMKELMRLVCLINYTMRFIVMVLDPRDGELAVRCSISHQGCELTDANIGLAINGCVSVFADYADALIGVILGWKTADEMFELIKAKHNKLLNTYDEADGE